MILRKKKTPQLNYFVSIGSGLNQIPLITEAKNLGLHVIGVDASASAAGFYLCDLKIQESIENYDAIYKKLLELLVDGDIRGIMTKSYGPAIITTSYLTEKFSIPFLPFANSGSFINKRKMKSVFIEHKIQTPRLIPLTSRMKPEKLSAGSYPVIIKPNIGHAKKNVRLACDAAELKQYCSNQSQSGQDCIIEKFVAGDEMIAAGIINNKRYHLVEITDKKTSFPPYFIDLLHIAPSKFLHLSKKIEGIGQTVADAFGIVSSPLIMEIVVNGNEELYLIEAVPEFGGEFLPDVLIPASADYNIIQEAIKSSTKTGFRPPELRKTKHAVVVRYVTGRNGILASCNPKGPQNVKGTIFARIFKEIGSTIHDPSTNLDRIGVVAVAAETVGEAIALSEQAADNFNIRIK